ncbi:FAD-dependent oxidoreductase [Deinococcus sedimenti]|uniref:Oxidoreductase n=1 Tax=Deinococcus sedimenti TaxID=1867090 RepID=A0ABQ2S4D0_9DEIO|nr:NAD(P)/FAD-dependent oxidoreductase [Deinococcus sedimenti]GGR93443.1 oxidoreductase [Deinococcus sedimenti]
MLDAVIVGGGPVGLFLGLLLARRGLQVQVLERQPQPGTHSRAIGLHPPALRALDAAGVGDSLRAAGRPIRRAAVIGDRGLVGELDFGGVPGGPVLSLPQRDTERLLAGHLAACAPGTLRRSVEVTAVQDQGDHVAVTACTPAGPDVIRARWVVGADGTRSAVRTLLGVPYPGGTYPDTYLMGDFPDTTAYRDQAVIFLTPGGVVESFPLPSGERRWVARTDRLQRGATPQDLTALVRRRTGVYLPADECLMLSPFGVGRHLARRFVTGRVILIGDAAHEVSPIGGQGMNLGWLDAEALAPLLPDGSPAALRTFGHQRRRAAALAIRQAEFNMFFGRPAAPWQRRGREAALRALLTPALRPLLVQAFTMNWLRSARPGTTWPAS